MHMCDHIFERCCDTTPLDPNLAVSVNTFEKRMAFVSFRVVPADVTIQSDCVNGEVPFPLVNALQRRKGDQSIERHGASLGTNFNSLFDKSSSSAKMPPLPASRQLFEAFLYPSFRKSLAYHRLD